MKNIIATFHEALVSLNYKVVEGGEQEPQSPKGKLICKRKILIELLTVIFFIRQWKFGCIIIQDRVWKIIIIFKSLHCQ